MEMILFIISFLLSPIWPANDNIHENHLNIELDLFAVCDWNSPNRSISSDFLEMNKRENWNLFANNSNLTLMRLSSGLLPESTPELCVYMLLWVCYILCCAAPFGASPWIHNAATVIEFICGEWTKRQRCPVKKNHLLGCALYFAFHEELVNERKFSQAIVSMSARFDWNPSILFCGAIQPCVLLTIASNRRD